MNGLMIDMARLIERKSYYYKLIDFMSEWHMDTLQIHFSDNHGFAIKLKSFEAIAAPNAFSEDEIKDLVSYAEKKDIELIPELEVFGHTGFLTGHPLYQHLGIKRQNHATSFNVVDPLDPETEKLMMALIKNTAFLFKSEYFHIGCDEVDIDSYCHKKKLDKYITWVNYVNKIIGIVKDTGKHPIIWADHPAKNETVARKLCKDVRLVYWNYRPQFDKNEFQRLVRNGFKNIILAPSLSWCFTRFFSPQSAFDNLDAMLCLKKEYEVAGIINTLWCPWRYLQNTLYYGIARSAEKTRLEDGFDINEFNIKFASRFFHAPNNLFLLEFLKLWPQSEINAWLVKKFEEHKYEILPEEAPTISKVNSLAVNLLNLSKKINVSHNQDAWKSFVLSVKCAWLCTEALLLNASSNKGMERINKYLKTLNNVRNAFEEDWKQGRYHEDIFSHHPGEKRFQYAFLSIQDLPEKFN